MLLPPGWIRLPVDVRAEAEIAKLVALRASAAPARDRAGLTAVLRRDLTDLVASAAAADGIEVYLCIDPVRGRPISAACVVSYVPPPAGGGVAKAPDLLPVLDLGDGERAAEVTLAPVGGAMAVRRRYQRDGDPEREHGNAAASTHVEYLVPVPGSGAHLLLSFSTVTAQVADALVVLFDAVAATLTWRW